MDNEPSPAAVMWLGSAVFALFLADGTSLLFQGSGTASRVVAVATFFSAFMVPLMIKNRVATHPDESAG